MPEPSVGVAVAVRDGERWLGAALESVLTQTLRVVDVVVIDDGSRDESAAVAARYAPLIRVQRIPATGIGAARNRGIELVRGDLIATLDADDLLTPFSLQCRVAAMRNDPDLELVFGHERRFAGDLGAEPLPLDDPRPAHRCGALIIRRRAFESIGPFSVDLQVAEGLDWLLRAREQSIAELTLPDQVVWRRVHDANNSLVQRDSLAEFPRVLKASLDRRRDRL